MLDAIDATALRRWCDVTLRELVAHRDEINDLNVYPVPDGDTGTNLVLTMESVCKGLADAAPSDLASAAKVLAHSSLMGARGNSGVILSQLLRGVADVVGSCPSVSGSDLRAALRRATDLAYAAVAKPVEGTMLSVVRAAAEAAESNVGSSLEDVARGAAGAARVALARTPEQLDVLRLAGVVDAGGRGLVVLLDGLVEVITGVAASSAAAAGADLLAPLVPRDRSALTAAREAGSEEFGYELQLLLDADAAAVTALTAALGDLGDSLVVVGGDGLWNVHVHVNDVGAAFEAVVTAGRPHRITVTRFADQVASETGAGAGAVADPAAQAAAGATGRPVQVPSSARAVVAVAAGPGLSALFASAGAVVVDGGPTANPSTGELVAAVEGTGARHVVLLPNDSNVHGAARQAAAATTDDRRIVHVVPTRSPLQALAALAVHDVDRDPADDAIAMADAAAALRWAEITVAVREAQTTAGPCRAGDVLGLVEGEVVVVGTNLQDVGTDLLDRMLASGGELVTLVLGEGAPEALADALAAFVADEHPLVDVEVHRGEQPHYPLLLGVE